MKYESDEKLLVALKSLAESDDGKCAPSSVEKLLHEYFLSMQTSKAAQSELISNESRWQRCWNILIARPLISYGACASALILLVAGVMFSYNSSNPTLPYAPIFKASPPPIIGMEQPKNVSETYPGKKNIRRKFKVSQSIPFYGVMTVYAEPPEITTEFIYTGIDDTATPMERGRLVRTMVPRQMLASYGLPVDPAKMNIPVKADLLVNEDGSTRAVRFIR